MFEQRRLLLLHRHHFLNKRSCCAAFESRSVADLFYPALLNRLNKNRPGISPGNVGFIEPGRSQSLGFSPPDHVVRFRSQHPNPSRLQQEVAPGSKALPGLCQDPCNRTTS